MDHYERQEILKKFANDFRKGTPRTQRAQRFTNTVLSMMRDFIPEDDECRRVMEEHLLALGIANNLEVINVPPEKDHMDKLQLERAMIEQHPMMILADGPRTSTVGTCPHLDAE